MIPLARARLCLTCETVFDPLAPPAGPMFGTAYNQPLPGMLTNALNPRTQQAATCARAPGDYRGSVALKSWLAPALDQMLTRPDPIPGRC